jgi:hypothetical protein
MVKQFTVGDIAPAGTVINVAGEAVSLESLWADGPTFLTFLRHFG